MYKNTIVEKLKLVLIFIVTFVLLSASGITLINLTKNSRLTGKVSSQAAAQVTATPTITPAPTLTTTPNAISATPVPDYGKPVKLSIPRLNINLAIANGGIVNNDWELSEDKAHYALMTSKPNPTEGNTLIYGHNTSRVFWRTKDLKAGDTLIIETDAGKVIEYSFSSYDLVVPTDLSVFQYQGKPRVTLLTCNGWNDKYRKLMYFFPVSVKDKNA